MSGSLVRLALRSFEEQQPKAPRNRTRLLQIPCLPKDDTKDNKEKRKSRAALKAERKRNNLKLKKSVDDVRMRCILDEVKRKKNMNHTIRNLRFLERISANTKSTVGKHVVTKIVTQHRGRLSRNQAEAEETKEGKTAFTEADFEKFERTYFAK